MTKMDNAENCDQFFDVEGCNNGKKFSKSHKFKKKSNAKNDLIVWVLIVIIILFCIILIANYDNGEKNIVTATELPNQTKATLISKEQNPDYKTRVKNDRIIADKL